MRIKNAIYIVSSCIVLAVPAHAAGASAAEHGFSLTVECPPGGRSTAPGLDIPGESGSGGFGEVLDLESRCTVIGQNVQPFIGNVIDTVIVLGNTRTKRETIIREIATKRGDLLDNEMIIRDASFLRGLGFFSDVDISAEKTAPGQCRVIVRVDERPDLFMKYPYPVVNYDLDKGISYGIRWRIRNFRGLGEELLFSALKRRDIEHGGGLSWNSPWVGGRRIKLNVNLFTYRKLDEPASDDFIRESIGGMVTVGLPLSRSLVRQVWLSTILSLEGRHSRMRIPPDDGSGIGLYYRQNLLSTGLRLRYDSRDNYTAASKGLLTQFSATRYTSIHGLTQHYTFYRATNHLFLPAGPMGTCILAIEANIRDGGLPWFFEMKLGGNNDLRGFEDDTLRGSTKVLGTVQLRRRFFGPHIFNLPHIGKFDVTLNAVAFVDNGALMRRFGDLGNATFHTTGGVGIEIMSPVQDLVRLELATNGDGSADVYLVAGSRF